MYGLSKERYQYLHDSLHIEDYSLKRFIDLYGIDGVEHGYYVTDKPPYKGSNVIPGALHISYVPEAFNKLLPEEACWQAVKDGVSFINDMPGLQKGFYIDTPENREVCAKGLAQNPELRIERWLNLNSSFGRNYAEHFPDILDTLGKQKVENYVIEDQITVKGTTYVMGHNPTAPAPYATWRKRGPDDYVTGSYYVNEADARLSLFSRALAELPEMEKSDIALWNLSETAKETIEKEYRETNALGDIESCLYDAVENLDMPDEVVSELLNDPEFKAAALRCYWRQDHSYENEALSQSLEEMIRDEFPEKLPPKEIKAVLKISPEELAIMNDVLSMTRAEVLKKYGEMEPSGPMEFVKHFEPVGRSSSMYISVCPKETSTGENSIEIVLYPYHPNAGINADIKNKVEITLTGVSSLEGLYSVEDYKGYTWTVDLHADERERRIGREYVFNTEGEEPEELAHQGQLCKVLRMLTTEENQPLYSGIMWKVQFQDGVVLDAWDHELGHTRARQLDIAQNPAQQKPVSTEKAGIDAQIRNASARAGSAAAEKTTRDLEK